MKAEKIQTLHPHPEKTGRSIALDKYDVIRATLLDILAQVEPTHTELMEALYARLKDTFQGGIQWYGETVKLDLEARHIIERTGNQPERYRLVGIVFQ